MDAREDIEDSLAHLIPRTPFPQYVDDTVYLEIKELLAQHPEKLVKAWSEKPRLYALLRMLDYHDEGHVFGKFDNENMSDFWLPLGPAILNQLATSVGLSVPRFRRTQHHVLSRPEDMGEPRLLGPVHAHRHIQYGSSHFDELEKIGQGGSAQVMRVRHKLSGRQFACKRILRADTIKAQREQLVEFEQEAGVLQRINHHHFVSLVASFTDLASFSLILNPVASDDLRSLLERQTRDQPLGPASVAALRHSFCCLATALAHLHQQHIRHKDIKPGNILIDSHGRILLCDFGISLDWSNSENSTTEGMPRKVTARYCAPEIKEHDKRNTTSDIWSLGCVFLEIITVIKGYTLGEFNDFLLENSHNESSLGLWCVPDAMTAWLVKLKSRDNDSADDLPLDWITPMIRTDPKDRLRASDIVDMIHKQTAVHVPQSDLFIATCCARSASVSSEVVGSPTLTNPAFGRDDGLGITHVSTSPPRYLGLPRRNHSPASIDESSSTHSRTREPTRPRDPSISPRTQPLHSQRDSLDTVPFTMDLPLPSANNKPSQQVLPRRDSQHTSSFSFPQHAVSIASSSEFRRSPVPPPASFEVKCECAARPNEKHIFNAHLVDIALDHETLKSRTADGIDAAMPSAESCPKCEIGENRIQIYESPFEDPGMGNSQIPMIWWVTRRLVISYLSGTPEMRRCSSFWLPLADIQFVASGAKVTLRWSDCNQMTQRSAGNYSQHYDWIYNPKQPNNGLALQFRDIGDAQRFIDTVRLPYEDGITVSHGRCIEASQSSQVNIFDIGRRYVRNYRVAVVTTINGQLFTSKLFIQWPEMDLNIQILRAGATPDEYQMNVECNNVSTPTYHSDVRGEPAVDYQKIGHFNKALQLKTGFVVIFPIGMARDLPLPPQSVVQMLQGLTGWILRYFGIVEDIKSKRKHFGNKKYGRADVLLWEKEIDDSVTSTKTRLSQVTFRRHEEGEFPWTSGTITAKSGVRFDSGTDLTVTVVNKAKGRFLDVERMAAVTSEGPLEVRSTHSRSSSETQEDLSDLILTFPDVRYRIAFFNLIGDFKSAAVATATIAHVPTRTATSIDSVHRVGSLASANVHLSPPMR